MKINKSGPPVVEIDLAAMTNDEVLDVLDNLPDEMMVRLAYTGPAKRVLPLLAHLCSLDDVRGTVTFATSSE